MRTIRRLYFYAVAGISLEVVLWGVIGLLRSIVSSTLTDTANALAQALALVLVGVPIFLFHWIWVQRASVRDAEERTASLRAIFLYVVLLATLVPVVQNLLALIDRSILDLADVNISRAFLGGYQTWQDNLIAIAVNVIAAAYFWKTTRESWESLSETENFADVRRLYRYLWLLYSLLMVVFGAQQLLRYAFDLPVPDNVLGNIGRETFANGLTLLLVGTPLWITTWRICQDALAAPVERDSNLRLGVLYLLALGGVISVLSAGGTLLDVIMRRVLGEAMAGYEFVREIGGPISLGVPLAGVWAYYGGWLGRQIRSDADEARRAGKRRFYTYILSALGLGATFIGVTLLFSFVIDLLVSSAVWGETLRLRLAGSLATLAVGLPLWLRTWRSMQAEAMDASEMGDHARRSTIRRAYLFLAIFAGVIGGMAAAVGLLYLVLNNLLSSELEIDFVSQFLNLTQLLGLFVILLVYHLTVLRRDNARAGAALQARQHEFPVAVIDPGDEHFVKAVGAAMQKHAPGLPLVVQGAGEKFSKGTGEAKAVILPASLAVDPPPRLRSWLKRFKGRKIVVEGSVSGWVLTGLNPEQAAKATRQLAEGGEVRLTRYSPVWNVLQTIAVIWFGLQILFILLALGVSLLAG